ncbi:MAG: hypothetical protein A3E85_00180 [Gammaproteobacteria bacterium RIFCSPHIGHO2_12_FULL_45_12]|nr:MAG: hypothetical protein A3E85_00180 [Gammaproteobacteria bacterium RIFCSPHIGHO2_12_FULL_45_12]
MTKSSLSSYDLLFQQFDSHTTLLTPNRRLSAYLHQVFKDRQREQPSSCWSTPDILPLTSWLERLWQQSVCQTFKPAPTLLSASQTDTVWETILKHDKENEALLQLSETADMAQSAWRLIKEWQLNFKDASFLTTPDTAAMQRWATHFTQTCHEKQWLDAACLPERLAEKMLSGDIHLPEKILLTGFTELPPQHQQLFSRCREMGTTVTSVNQTLPHSNHRRLNLADQESEILTLARWAKATLTQHPEASIGCVIQTLDKTRDRVWQIFSEVFETTDSRLFNMTAGKSLSRYPLIHTALVLLNLHQRSLSTQTVSYLLSSPFIGEAEQEQMARSMLDHHIRKTNINQIDLSEPNDAIKTYCPKLAKRLQDFFICLHQTDSLQSFQAWAKTFHDCLTLLGFPGERSLNSAEYQTVEQWLTLLNELMTLDHVAGAVNFKQALHHLNKLAAKRSFQPKTPDAPVQVLGLLEAAALPFDYLWVTGMDDMSWPEQARPNPFIPKRLQRDLNMPHGSAERELAFCQQLTAQFKQSAPHVIFSHTDKQDELALEASALILDLPTQRLMDLALPPFQSINDIVYDSKQLESLLDNTVPISVTDSKTPGGVNLLKLQALCPFKAFAESRLHAKALHAPLPGLRPKDRGNTLHKCLELLWNTLQDQATLLQMEDETLNQLIERCILNALAEETPPHHLNTHYLMLEKSRLHQLLSRWLALEKKRPAFKVLANEAAIQYTLGHLTLSVKIDRIDEIDSGKKLIIDYKSGKNNQLHHWFGARPEEPQLPFYALTDTHQVAGITYAQVHTANCVFKGISQETLDIDGIKPLSDVNMAESLSWPEQLTAWKTVLTHLSDQIYQGVADVDPKDPGQTCTHCHLKSLCRINEAFP